jgi:hypothetical protein
MQNSYGYSRKTASCATGREKTFKRRRLSVKQKAKKLSLLINENWDEQREAWVQLKFKGAENEEREPVQA